MANKSTVIEDLNFYIRDGVMDFKDYFIPMDAISFVKLNTPKDLVLIGYLITAAAGAVFAFSKKWFIIVAGVLVIALSIFGMISGYLKNRRQSSELVIQTNSGQTFLLKHKDSKFLSDLMLILKTGRTNKLLFYHIDVQKGTILDGNDAAASSGFPIPTAATAYSNSLMASGAAYPDNGAPTDKTAHPGSVTAFPANSALNRATSARAAAPNMARTNSLRSNRNNHRSVEPIPEKKPRPRYYSASEYVRNHGVVTEVAPIPAKAQLTEENDIFHDIEKAPADSADADPNVITKKNWTDIEFLFFQRKTTFSPTDSKYKLCEKLEDFAYHKDKEGMRDYFQAIPKNQLHTILSGFDKPDIELLMKIIH